MSDRIAYYLNKADQEDQKKNRDINRHNANIEKYEQEAYKLAEKQYTNTYLAKLGSLVNKTGFDYQQKEFQALVACVNEGDMTIETIRLISKYEKKFGQDLLYDNNIGVIERFRSWRADND